MFNTDASFPQVFLSMARESIGDRAHRHGEQTVYINVHPSSSVSLENRDFYSPEKYCRRLSTCSPLSPQFLRFSSIPWARVMGSLQPGAQSRLS